MPPFRSAARFFAPSTAGLLAVLLNYGPSLPASYGAPVVEWVRKIATDGWDDGAGVESDGQGNVYMAGLQNSEAAISRLHSDGAVAWTKINDSPNPYSSNGYSDVVVDGHGRVYVAGVSGYDATVARYSTDGALMWQRTFGTDLWDDIGGAGTDGAGNVYITGHTNGDLVRPVEGPGDGIVSKFDENGNQLWTKQFGTDGAESGTRLTVDRMGNVLVGAYTSGDFAGANPDDGFIRDALVLKLDADGNTLWARQSSRPGDDYASGVGSDQAGNVYLGRTDGGIVKYDVNGNLVWERAGVSGFEAQGLTVDALGNAYLSGAVGAVNGDILNSDAAIVRYLPDGTRGWMLTMGSPTFELATSIHTDGLGNLYVTGSTYGAFGGPFVGGIDAFVLKIAGAVPEPAGWITAMTPLAAIAAGRGLIRWPKNIARNPRGDGDNQRRQDSSAL